MMATLTDTQKEEVVTLLAMFRRPADVVAYMQVEWGIEIDRFQVRSYDPTNPRYEAGSKWREIFSAKRKCYVEEVASIPIANQGYRMNLLNEMTTKAIAQGQIALAAQLLEQAAKEMGRSMTNQSELRITDNRKPTAREMSPEDRKLAVADLVRQAMARIADSETCQ